MLNLDYIARVTLPKMLFGDYRPQRIPACNVSVFAQTLPKRRLYGNVLPSNILRWPCLEEQHWRILHESCSMANPVELKHVLCQIDPEHCYLHHWTLMLDMLDILRTILDSTVRGCSSKMGESIPLIRHLRRALKRNGFFGPNSYDMHHAANARYASKAVHGGDRDLCSLAGAFTTA